MCSLAPRAAAPGIGATAFLDRQRGVMAAPAAASRCHNAGEPTTTRRARVSEASADAPARKRGRHDAGFEHDVVVVDPAAAASSSALRGRMDKELVALQGLLKRAKLLPRRSTDPSAEKKTEVPRKRRPEEEQKELARGAIVVWNSTREEFRQMLVEVEKAALPDETVYPEEMEALGIPFEFVVTRTWKQAMLEDNGKIVECS